MRGTVARAAAFGVLAASCGLATSGLERVTASPSDAGTSTTSTTPVPDATILDSAPPPSGDAAPSPVNDASPPANDAEGGVGAEAGEDGAAEAGEDAAADACGARTNDAGALATISPWPGPPAPSIDGNLSEWPCNGFVHFSSANAAYVKGGAGSLAADVQVRWDLQDVYFAVHVTESTVGAGGYSPINPYDNDSVEVYVSGDATLDGDYDDMTHQYITDYKGLSLDYGPTHYGSVADAVHQYFSAAALVVPGGWNFEGEVAWQALLATGPGFSTSTNLGLSFEVNRGNGSNQVAALVLVMAPPSATCTCTQSCCCGGTPDVPSCDSERFERATLQ